MIYAFYSKDDKTEADFILIHANLRLEGFIDEYKKRFQSNPAIIYNDDIEAEDKAIKILRQHPESYGFIVFDE